MKTSKRRTQIARLSMRLLLAVGATACGSSKSGSAQDLAAPPRDLAGDMAGSNTVSGTIAGTPFGPVMTAWMIGHPDSASTTVVYLFNAVVGCRDASIDFGQMGWDSNLPDRTQFLELKLFGPASQKSPPTMPGQFQVTASLTPAPGEASTNHSVTHAGAASVEGSAASGTVVLSDIVDKSSATGTFTLTFSGDQLAGSFAAGFCDVGVEP